jgi:hypothetical protein
VKSRVTIFPKPCPGALALSPACSGFHGVESARFHLFVLAGSVISLVFHQECARPLLVLATACLPAATPTSVECFGSFPPVLTKFDFGIDLALRVCESLQGDVGIALESPDQKTRGFMVQIALPW